MALTEDSGVVAVAGKKAGALLEKNKGIRTVGDLFEFVPRRYLHPGRLSDFTALVEGEWAVVVARVAEAQTRPMARNPRQKMLTAVLTDGQHRLGLTFFKAWGHVDAIVPGRVGVFAGTVSRYRGAWQLTHPEYEMLEGAQLDPQGPLELVDPGAAPEPLALDDGLAHDWATHQVPVYSTTGTVTSLQLRRMVVTALDTVSEVREPLPAEVRERRGLVGREQALRLVHRPLLDEDPRVGIDRLRYDEAFVLQTILAQRRAATEALQGTSRVARPGGVLEAFDARLPFELTGGQREIGDLLTRELAARRPMHRLLQGEVGSGKTIVALRAMLAVVDAGGQAALLAPTEVLAVQHHRSIRSMLGDLAEGGRLGGSEVGTRVALLTGGQPAAGRRATLNDVVTGDAGIVIGTHALIQKHVAFRDLALVVVDEQHRFGVEQRDALREKGVTPPHLLVMTATPIPRTVAMTVFGDMETSTLRELPSGRSPIVTHVVPAALPSWLERTWQRLAEEVAAGHQAFVVCPKIGDDQGPGTGGGDDGWSDEEWAPVDDEADPVDDPDRPEGADEAPRELVGVMQLAEQLLAEPALRSLHIGVLHGRMPTETKDAVMSAFAAGDLDVLVATTVIEVGVDVPNATVMVVMDADRFGISQLHQLRGRIGRGSAAGLCLLVTPAPPDSPAGERLTAVASTTDGFELARRDLQLRREGDVLGARQSGRSSSVRFLRMGNRDDEQVISDARDDATALVASDASLSGHPALAARVAARLDEEQAAYLERG
ncbi:MAG: ATP-dependent DNA helicase RecG [Actinomycetota bacterium]|nr:ATP-dependent DNA helicase RecG [Actinomycetota bacterium]